MKKKVQRFLAALLSVLLCLPMLPATAFAAGMPFRDVSQGQWYYEAVDYAYRNGIMSGESATRFSPNTNVTRAQMCQILYNLEGKPDVSGNAFSDVRQSDWYYQAVNWAADQQIVGGVDEGRFDPNTPISREQLVLILYRYGAYTGYDVEGAVSIDAFADAGTVSSWAETAVRWAVGDGIISGTDGNRLNPGGTATRAQTATMMMRFDRQVEQYLAFKAKDVDDFAGYEVINFDGSDETNFAVLDKDTVSSETVGSTNQLVSADEENGVYVFDNADADILSLQAGDMFYHVYGSGADDYILIKVASIAVDGTDVTLTAGEAELSEYFAYIDLDVEGEMPAGSFDASDADEGVTYLGTEPGSPAAALAQPEEEVLARALQGSMPDSLARSINGSSSTQFKFGIKKDTFEVTARIKMTFTLKIEYDSIFTGIDELEFKYKQEMALDGKLKKSFTGKEETYKGKLGKATVPIAATVNAQLEVYYVFDVDAEVDGTFTAVYVSESGVKYRDKKAHSIREEESDISADIGGSFRAKAGLGLSGKINALKVFFLSLSGEGGAELVGDMETALGISANEIENHLCAVCIDGDINGFLELKLTAKVGVTEKKAWTLLDWKLAEVKAKLGDFYISFPDVANTTEYGKGDCPNKTYRVRVGVLDQVGDPVVGSLVSVIETETGYTAAYGDTDSQGIVTMYCPLGSYAVIAGGPEGYEAKSEEQDFTLTNKGVILQLKLKNENPQVEVDYLTDMMGLTVADVMRYLDASGTWRYEEDLRFSYEWPCFNYVSSNDDYLFFSIDEGDREILYEDKEMLDQYSASIYYGLWDGRFGSRWYVEDTLVCEESYMPCDIMQIDTEPYTAAQLPVCPGIRSVDNLREIEAACKQYGYDYEVIEDEGGYTYYEIDPSVTLRITYDEDIVVQFVWYDANISSASPVSADQISLWERIEGME